MRMVIGCLNCIDMENVRRFIIENIDNTTKNNKANEGDETLLPLPYPFTTPCVSGTFQEMYYWDTYFTQKALFLSGREKQAENNVRNFAYLLEKYGKIPNGNRTWYLRNSQPPFLGLMLLDMLIHAPQSISLLEAFSWLKKEYDFWMTKRIAPNGLNAYNIDTEDFADAGTFEWYQSRTGICLEQTVENCRCIYSECESGWDFSPRFHSRCIYHNPVDLNCLLFLDETLLGKWTLELGKNEESVYYFNLAQNRKEKILTLMKTNKGYFDFDFEKNVHSDVVSCAGLFPFAVGLDDDKEIFLKTLAHLEREYGVVACLNTDGNQYQWCEPNGWAPLQYIAVLAAEKLGLKDDAKRIVEKYLNAQSCIFHKTNRLWEKYNAETGGLDVVSEYGTPEMLGWSAGVYMAFLNYRENGYKQLI